MVEVDGVVVVGLRAGLVVAVAVGKTRVSYLHGEKERERVIFIRQILMGNLHYKVYTTKTLVAGSWYITWNGAHSRKGRNYIF